MSQTLTTSVSPRPAAQDTRLRLLLCGILLAVYMLIYTGQPGSIDGQATLAAADSFLKHGTPDITILGSAEALLPPLARMGSFGTDGLLYSKKGVTPSLILLPFVLLAQTAPFLPVRATALLLNPICTTLTALLLYTFARWLNYPSRAAWLMALIYGLGTFAVIYTTSLFGEPLAALLLLAALMCAYRYRQHTQLRTLITAGFILGLLSGINLTYAVMAPLIGLYSFGPDPRRWRLSRLMALVGPFLLMILLLLVYNWARFGTPLESGYNFAEGEGFVVPFGLGAFGLLLSPYRGMIWYNPVLLMAVPGAWLLRRRNAELVSTILVLFIAQVMTYASWWSWHGGVVWGPRFLIPVTPLLTLLLLPIIDRILYQRVTTILFAALAGLSLAIQAVAGLFSFIPHIIYLYQNFASTVVDGFFIDYDPEVIFRWDVSPVIAQFRLAFSGEQALQPALFKHSDPIHGVLVLVLAATGFWAYHYTKSRWQVVIAGIMMAASLLGVAVRQTDQMSVAQTVESELTAAEMLIAASTSYGDNLLDLKSSMRVITTNAPTPSDDPLTVGLWGYAMRQTGRTWFVTWFPPASAENWQERALWESASFVRETLFRDNRALLFDLNPTAPPDQTGAWRFGPIQLDMYGIQRETAGLRITLIWKANIPPQQDLTWFVHLVDASGQIIQQQDRAPLGGYAPTSSWESDRQVSDYLYFPLNPETATAELYLRVGWVDPNSGDRLPVIDSAGGSIPDRFILLPVP